MKKLLTSLIAPVFLSTSICLAQDLADFGIPAASDNPAQERTVKDPAAVTTTENSELDEKVISAATTQDAVNAAQQELIDSGDEARFISTGSGLGTVAVGYGSYNFDVSNVNLKLIEQRAAYLEATLEARTSMAEFLRGLSLEGKQELVKQFDMVDGGEESLANMSSISSESINERVNGMLRGVVIYDVQDDPQEGTVCVTVVTTPKTQGAIQATGNNTMIAENIADGLQAIFTEVKAGLVPPDGGRVVTVPSSGQIAWVGFGSEINRTNRNKTLQRELKREAVDTAKMRARRSLLAVINGENVSKDSQLNQELEKQITQFDRIPGVEGEAGIERKEEDAVSAFAQQVKTRAFGSTTTGTLPPGVSVKSYQSKDGSWSYAVAIYTAQATDAAKSLAQVMDANSPLGSVSQTRGFETNPDGSFKRGPDGNLIPKSIGSGRVTKDEDL
ncbi:MAG: hypothetical protein P8J86_03360 [Phycisphaerales bacterium]|nr:hypothetical protein [Phycisphaerales bacterium]